MSLLLVLMCVRLVGAFVPGPPRYRIQYEDDDSIVEETLRAPWYELVEGES